MEKYVEIKKKSIDYVFHLTIQQDCQGAGSDELFSRRTDLMSSCNPISLKNRDPVYTFC